MINHRSFSSLAILSFSLAAMVLGGPSNLTAHCDTMSGPVIKAAQKALETGHVNLVLIWIKKDDEAEIEMAFQRALSVRKLGPEARDMADMYFFETLVRLHRAGEGAPYTGLKPAGLDLGPVIPASDKALETGSVDALEKLLVDAVRQNVPEHFRELMERKAFDENDVEAGRRFVATYVLFTHYVEKIHEAVLRPEAHDGSGAANH